MKFYIGVDGGGTKTAFALFDENKNMLELHEGPASNHENMEGSFPQAADIITAGVDALLEKTGKKRDDITGMLMGLAGIDHPYQHDAMCEELTKRGLKDFRIYNDGFIVIKAGGKAGAGIGYNCGTGTCCNSIDSRGEMLQIGGFDRLSGDKGNGHWVAYEAFRIVYDDVCLGKRESKITAALAEKLGIKDRTTLLDSIQIIEDEEKSEAFIRVLIVSFFDAANNGDEAALEVIEEMAQRGADFIGGHIKKMQFDEETVNVVLSGSMNVKMPNEIYLASLKAKCEAKSGRKLNFIKLEAAPVTGCINWLLEN